MMNNEHAQYLLIGQGIEAQILHRHLKVEKSRNEQKRGWRILAVGGNSVTAASGKNNTNGEEGK